MITGDKGLGQSVENGPTTIGQDGVIQQGKPSGPPHEGSRETYEGKIISVPRDYCWTPCGSGKILIGYKIWAFQREATNLANSVTQTSLRSHVKGSIIKHCYGDDAGKLGGFTSGTHNGSCTPKTWSQTVLWESRNAVRDSDEWWMNNYNTWGVLDYKKDMNQYSTDDPEKVDAKMYLASAAAPALGGAGAAGEGWSAGEVASTVGNYAMRGVTAVGEGGMAVTGALAGVFLLGSTSSTASPEQDQPFPHGIPPSTPAAPQPTSPPPSTPTAQQPTSPPPSTPVEQQPTSPPPPRPPNSNPRPHRLLHPQRTRDRRSWSLARYQNGRFKMGSTPMPFARRKPQIRSALATGKNGGGAYGQVGGHHMPAQAISPLPESWGPAIQIDPSDHKKLPSTGSPSTSQGMSAQGALAQQDYMKAFDNDAAAVQSRFPGKYDQAIADARAYAECLKQKGLVK